jgi:hypothetical protein
MMYDWFQVSKNTPEKQKELLPLAESIRGEAVPFNDLKKTVIIAIQTMKKVLGRLEKIHDSSPKQRLQPRCITQKSLFND